MTPTTVIVTGGLVAPGPSSVTLVSGVGKNDGLVRILFPRTGVRDTQVGIYVVEVVVLAMSHPLLQL